MDAEQRSDSVRVSRQKHLSFGNVYQAERKHAVQALYSFLYAKLLVQMGYALDVTVRFVVEAELFLQLEDKEVQIKTVTS